MKNLFLIAVGLTFFAATGRAQQAPAQPYNFSLADCIKYAYEHQDSVQNAILDAKSAEYKVKETIGIGLPQISGTVSFQDYLKTPQILFPDFISPAVYGVLANEGVKNGSNQTIVVPKASGATQSVSFTQKYSNTLGLDVNQIIFDGSYLVGLKASKTYKELSQKAVVRSKIQTNVSVTKAYYQVLVSNEQIKLLAANINQLKQQLDETTAQNKQGFVEKIDVQRLEVQYNNLVTNRENIVRSLVLNYEMLKFQMGMPIQNQLTLTDQLENVQLDQSVAESVVDTAFYHKRIEFSLLETSKQLNELDLKRKKSQYLPSLVAFGNTGLQFQDNSFGNLYNINYPSTYVGLKLSVPIFNGFQRKYQVKQSEISVLKSQNDLANLKNGLSLQAEASRINYMNGIQSLNNQKRSRELAQEVLRVSKIKYQQGVGSSIEVTQAQTALETADNQYIQALYDALVNKVNLDQAYGRIN
ncbi:TolC family protein [Mucilaginibacter paludis]|uniref:Outer membrane efflux protein n=1 Tax=Mucilaginibacter paludis DSM 18603 TaxID=714943 RepID=H1Y7K4_9SPHI|nr:TolC family protein [Mucilaginibacter paludis]EHQ29425.1 outer membrane efflux protein [Mucilaginibacter paludis DSM 18603]